MGQPQLKPMDIAGFLIWEERQELRHEFDGVQTIAMTGGTRAHSRIQAGIVAALNAHLRGSLFHAHAGHMKIRTPKGIRYPDAFVVCSPGWPSDTVVTDPVLIVEVLSESTAHEDFFVKTAEYQAIPTVQRYIILQQTHRIAVVFHRRGDRWEFAFVSGEGAMLDMPEIGISVPLAEIYEDIALEGDLAEGQQPPS